MNTQDTHCRTMYIQLSHSTLSLNITRKMYHMRPVVSDEFLKVKI